MNRLKLVAYSVMLVFIMVFSCKKENKAQVNADAIINKAIEVSGGSKLDSSILMFSFRDKKYKATRNFGAYTLERAFRDSLNKYNDVLSNNGFQRFINSERIIVADSMASRYSNSVNSVHYFSVLPYGLNDKAVNKLYLGRALIKGREYHKIKVTFNEEGGGEDFEDVFVYWVQTETFKVDYLAYSYAVNGGGMRFREAYNERFVNGIRFVDYNNYKPENEKESSVFDLDSLFETGELILLSKIELENVKVSI